jgi:hypothetical protein
MELIRFCSRYAGGGSHLKNSTKIFVESTFEYIYVLNENISNFIIYSPHKSGVNVAEDLMKS